MAGLTFKAMQIAIAALPAELSDAVLSLAVFPSDTQIPIAAITRYWAHTRSRSAEDTARDLAALAAANVVRVDGDAVDFHDLQHDYLLLHAPRLALLHAGLPTYHHLTTRVFPTTRGFGSDHNTTATEACPQTDNATPPPAGGELEVPTLWG